MRPFTHVRARDLSEAVASSAEDGATILAGGTNLVDLMREYVRTPDRVVDIAGLPLGGIEERDGLVLGALSSNTTVADHPVVKERYAALSEAILAGASQQIRNRATTGGNILQCTRDPFYWNVAYGAPRRPGGERDMAAVDEASMRLPVRYHAVLGLDGATGRAANPSDMAAALAIYDPVVEITGPDGARRVPYADFHRRTGRGPTEETVLRRGEVITALRLPRPPRGRSGYAKLRERTSYAYALASVAMHRGPGGVRVAFGSVAPVPWRARAAERVLNAGGGAEEAVAAEFEGVVVPEELAFKQPMLAGAVADLFTRLEG